MPSFPFFDLGATQEETATPTTMNGLASPQIKSTAFNSGVLDVLDTDMATPKASAGPKSKKRTNDDEVLSTSTPSTISVASTALPSPELPGPATNFGVVCEGRIYRSSFPRLPNFEHMASLGLKTIVTLVDEPYPLENQQFVTHYGIMHVQLPLPGHKNAFTSIPVQSMERVLSIVMDPRNQPVLIHCNKGKHRTGCVVGCYRKITSWTMLEILHEYRHYAGKKARSLDESYIALFDEEAMKASIDCLLDPTGVARAAEQLSHSAPAATYGVPR